MTDEMSYGDAMEDEVRKIAARLGVADFVYTVPILSKGAGGSREVGDALLISNGRGAIIQVKTREPNSRSETGEAWLAKHGERAYRQGQGTRRQIGEKQKSGEILTAYPVRTENWALKVRGEAALSLDMDVSGWPTIIVVDHPNVDGTQPTRTDAFWITPDDWLMLNRAIRSVTGLLIYVERSLEAGPRVCPPLGHEDERFRQMVQADAVFSSTGGKSSRPWLTADSLNDPTGAQLYRELLERIWPENPEELPHVPIGDARRILEFLDGVPPSMQAEAGRWILKKRSEIVDGVWASGALMFNSERLFIFGCSPANSFVDIEHFDAKLASIACVRAKEISMQGVAITSLLAVGHIVGDGYIDYRYIYMEPPRDAPAELMRSIRHHHGMFNLKTREVNLIKAERNARCPCGSGLKFKYCDRA
ncbi:MAG TPA: SEC-C metal-binding domain-containing protein [Candidatus Paceibacterota bacterium]|nr:SEC-C metal-binding domain-containing protein [Candidatus Paceibacterota bacterium]